jgi:hypothetical protein
MATLPISTSQTAISNVFAAPSTPNNHTLDKQNVPVLKAVVACEPPPALTATEQAG